MLPYSFLIRTKRENYSVEKKNREKEASKKSIRTVANMYCRATSCFVQLRLAFFNDKSEIVER